MDSEFKQDKGASSPHCRVCNGICSPKFQSKILHKHEIGFYKCSVCESLQTETPYWLEESYADGTRRLDTNAVRRAEATKQLTFLFLKLTGIGTDRPILDWGAGDGLMVRMLRDIGLDAFHHDPLANNLYAIGFEHEDNRQYSAITSFEVYEHLPEPHIELEKIFKLAPQIHIASTTLYSGQGEDWHYLNTETGRHVFFYFRKAIQNIAQKYDYHAYVYSNKYIVFTQKPIPHLRRLVLDLLFDGPGRRLTNLLFHCYRKRSLAGADKAKLLKTPQLAERG